MGTRVKVLYDFDAQPGSGELTIKAGEILSVTRQDVGDGWWEGVTSSGQQGLFPESYVEVLPGGPPPMPPPPLPIGFDSPNRNGASVPPPTQQQQSSEHQNDDYDDDWSDDDSNKEEPGGGGSGNFGLSTRGARDAARSTGDVGSGKGTVKKNINRFSNFVKSGTEAYILNAVKLGRPLDNSERIEIIIAADGPQWAETSPPYTCKVDSPKKESKLKGLKSFIAYQLTPSFSNIQVSRRYKHFDWLHERLTEKFAFIPVPPLPEKQISGRYEDDLIEYRMALLQLWVNKICRHPVLARSDVWLHFISTTDEKKWKQGKRKAEKDEYTGGNLFLSISAPSQPLDPTDVENRMENFSKMSRSLDDGVRNFFTVAQDCAKKMAGPYKREYLKMGAAFRQLGQSFELDQSPRSAGITNALKVTSETYDKIAVGFERQPKNDLEPLMHKLFSYKGMLSAIPDTVQVHKSALSKLKDHQRLAEEGKVSAADLEGIRGRVDTISYSMLAEVNHFQQERVVDFKATMSEFLHQQIAFYEQIVRDLHGALVQFQQ